MSVLSYVLIILGLFEIVSNLFHISKKSIDEIGKSAKRQHQELPLSVPNSHFYWKAVIMLGFGILFLVTGLLLFLQVSVAPLFAWIATISFGLYGVLQAIIYRKEIKVWPAMIVYNIPLIINIFVK